jgi:hypothetical protein
VDPVTNVNRRRLLASVGTAFLSSVVGCLGSVPGTGDADDTDTVAVTERSRDPVTTDSDPAPSDGSETDSDPASGDGSETDSGTSPGTAGLPTRFWLERASLSESERSGVDPIVFADLSPAGKEAVRTALDEGEYTVQREHGDPALDDLRDRIESRTDGGLEAYLRRGETYYRVGFAAGDHVIAHPDH